MRNIVRDIIARKKTLPASPSGNINTTPKPSGGRQKTVPDSGTKNSPFIVDLSEKNVTHADIHTSDIRGTNHATSGRLGETLVVRKHLGRTTSIMIQLSVLAVFGGLILFVVASARGYAAGGKLMRQITQSAKDGYGQIIQAGSAVKGNDLSVTQSMFEQAYSTFQQAKTQIWFIQSDPVLSRYTAVLESGSLLAESGKDMTEMLTRLQKIPELFAQTMNHVDESKLNNSQTPDSPVLAELKKANEVIIRVYGNIKQANREMDEVMEVAPKPYIEAIARGRTLLAESEKMLENMVRMLPGIIEIFGNNGPHRTLVLLQNNDEVRPTGGFIGSFLNLQMQHGYVTQLKLEDVYDMDGQFQEVVEPPEEIKKLTPRWFFRDSNYSPDFHVSGEKAIWFYEKERGEKADTVIAVNQDLLGKLLGMTGPIELASLSAPLTADNYREVLTYIVETKRSGADDPKKILKDLLPVVQKRLFQSGNMTQLHDAILEEVIQKNILGFSKNTLTQNFFEVLGADGRMSALSSVDNSTARKNEDYLNVTVTSIGGNKSDAYITQEILHDTVIEKGGEIYDQLTLKRTHTWSPVTEKKWRGLLRPFNFLDFPEHFLAIFGKGANTVVVRAYLPTGSEILSDGDDRPSAASALATSATSAPLTLRRDPNLVLDYVTFEMSTAPGQTSTKKIRYKLPFRLSNILANTYALNIQKQPGARASQLTKRISFRDFMPLAQTYPSDFIEVPEAGDVNGTTPAANTARNSLMIAKRLTRDHRLALLFTRKSIVSKFGRDEK